MVSWPQCCELDLERQRVYGIRFIDHLLIVDTQWKGTWCSLTESSCRPDILCSGLLSIYAKWAMFSLVVKALLTSQISWCKKAFLLSSSLVTALNQPRVWQQSDEDLSCQLWRFRHYRKMHACCSPVQWCQARRSKVLWTTATVII